MSTRFGYACLNMSLCAQKPKVFCSRSMIKRTFQAKGIDYASELALANTFDLIKYQLNNPYKNRNCLITKWPDARIIDS